MPTSAAKLRELLKRPGLTEAIGCHDVITARLIEQLGFEACYVGGHDMVAPTYALPDLGLAGMPEMLDLAGRASTLLGIPTIVDLDDGGGNPLRVAHTVRQAERLGIAGFHIEDNDFNKGKHLYGRAMWDDVRIPPEKFAHSVRAAVDARANPATIVIARTDAAATDVQEAIDRSLIYADAGADMIFACFLPVERAREFVQAVPVPVMMLARGVTVEMKRQLAEDGVSLLIQPVITRVAAFRAVYKLLKEIKENGAMLEPSLGAFDTEEARAFAEAEDAPEWAALVDKYGLRDS